LGGRIAEYLRHPLREMPQEPSQTAEILSALDRIVILLRDRSGNDFSLYKTNTLYRRIERRMAVHQIADLDGYVRYLRSNPQELDLLFKELLIGVTRFFRDPAVWESLRGEAIPSLLARHPYGGALRAWVPGCSTGEEAYSLTMVFKEALERVKPAGSFTLQVFATDLDRDAIDRARAGVYPSNIAADISPERLRRFFAQDEHGCRVGKEIRETLVFAPQNVIMDPPFTKLDLLICRNLLIYLDPGIQKKLIPLFHYSLNPDGILFLGSAETIGQPAGLFATLSGKSRIFQKTP
jgi:two-component system CheB/CheR fusion protein